MGDCTTVLNAPCHSQIHPKKTYPKCIYSREHDDSAIVVLLLHLFQSKTSVHIMQRRNVPLVTTHSEDSNRSGSSTLPLISKSHRAQGGGVGRPKDNNSTARVIILLAIAVLITLATYMFPDQVEQEAEYVVHEAQAAEQEFLHWWDHRQQPPIPFEEHPHFQGLNDKISQIKHEDGKWVAGEKKLKAKLKVLAEKQAKGELLGVPVLTRVSSPP